MFASTRIFRRGPSIRLGGTTSRSQSEWCQAFQTDSTSHYMRIRLLLAVTGLFAVDLSAQGRVQRPMTFDDFAAVRNVGDPQISPDGQWVLYSVRTTDVTANKRTTVTRLARIGLANEGNRGEPFGMATRQFPDAKT